MSVLACGAEVAADLAALHAQGFAGRDERPWSEAEFALLLRQPGVQALVAGTPPVGLALWRIAAAEAELLTLAVVPDARRTGVGMGLMAAVITGAGAAGARLLVLEVGTGNEAALSLYAGAGFHEIALRPSYYERGGAREDALVLARPLDGP